MRTTIVAALAAGMLLTGCARAMLTKPGGTAEMYEADKAACFSQAASAGDPIFASLFLNDCMRGKGWVRAGN